MYQRAKPISTLLLATVLLVFLSGCRSVPSEGPILAGPYPHGAGESEVATATSEPPASAKRETSLGGGRRLAHRKQAADDYVDNLIRQELGLDAQSDQAQPPAASARAGTGGTTELVARELGTVAPPPVAVASTAPVTVEPVAMPPVTVPVQVEPPAGSGSMEAKGVLSEPVSVEAPRVEIPVAPAVTVIPATPATVPALPPAVIPAPAVVAEKTPLAVEPEVAPVVESAEPVATQEPGRVTIQPDTVLRVEVREDGSLNGTYSANELGAIDLGYAGLIVLQDLTAEESAQRIREVLEKRYLRTATVNVRVVKASYDRVGAQGMVGRPGTVKVNPGGSITLKDLLLRSGGLAANVRNPRVKVIRGGLQSPFGIMAEGEVLPLVSEKGTPQIPGVTLRNNDLAYVFSGDGTGGEAPDTAKSITLLGEVGRPGLVTFSPGEPCTLMRLMFKIGGLPRFAKAEAVRIVRRDAAGNEQEFIANADLLLKRGNPKDDVPLQNGDVVIVPTRVISFF